MVVNSLIYPEFNFTIPYFVIVFSIFLLFINNIGYGYFIEFIADRKKCDSLGKNIKDEFSINYEYPKISIIIPTYNEEENIRKKIENILAYEYCLSKIELIIVDDGSLDNTKKIINNLISDFNGLLNITLIESKHEGPGKALKIGSNKATGDLILWTDADAYQLEDSLLRGVSHLHNEEVGVVCGNTKPTYDTKNTTVRATELILRDKLRFYESCIDSIIYTNATFFLFRQNFKNLITTNLNYDASLALKIRRIGFKVIFDPHIVSYHVEPTNIRTQLKRKKRIFLGLLELFIQNVDINFNKKYGKFGMIIAPRNLLFYVLEPFIFVILLVNLLLVFKLYFVYFSSLLCFILFILTRTKFKNISLLISQQLLGYLINFFSYFEFIIKCIFNIKIKYTPGK